MTNLKRKDIMELLSHGEMSMDDLVAALRKEHSGLDEAEIKSVVLPLISSREIELTSERKLKVVVHAAISA